MIINEHCSNEPTDTASSGTSSDIKEALCYSAGEKLDQEVSMWHPREDERAGFGSRGCPWMLDRGRQFYPRCLLLRALASEATRQVTSFLAS